jgi:hypothetical protein
MRGETKSSIKGICGGPGGKLGLIRIGFFKQTFLLCVDSHRLCGFPSQAS